MRGWCAAGLAEVGGGAVHSVADLGLFLRAVAYCQQRYDTSKPPSLTRAVVTSKAASKAAIESSGSQQYPCVRVCARAVLCSGCARPCGGEQNGPKRVQQGRPHHGK